MGEDVNKKDLNVMDEITRLGSAILSMSIIVFIVMMVLPNHPLLPVVYAVAIGMRIGDIVVAIRNKNKKELYFGLRFLPIAFLIATVFGFGAEWLMGK